ncbi:MAG: hypothetical protein AAF483_31055, partial [Planctomycetota bacterium]
MTSNRRSFLATSSGTSLLLGSGLVLTSKLPLLTASEANLESKHVQFSDDSEPLVQLIEESPRDVVLSRVAEKIREGASYQQVLTGLFLAAIRNVQPRPSVGFKFHCVLVVNSCHLASVAGPDEDRWLPIFWAIDYFKSSQADEKKRSGWKMPALANEREVPLGMTASKQFHAAMEQWDLEKADAATAGLVRSFGSNEVFEHFVRYAARDYRSIGHKAIYLANGWRTLQVIGWQHAEPVLRSLTFALLNHNGEPNPAKNDLAPDRSWREIDEVVNTFPENWRFGKNDSGLTNGIIQTHRQESPKAAFDFALDGLQKGIGAQSIWDATFVGAGELLMRQPGIIGLHGLTTANAMHYLWQTTRDEELRRKLLLQATAFNPQFRESAKGRGKLADFNYSAVDSDHYSEAGEQ